MSISQKAINDFQARQAPTLQKLRYMGVKLTDSGEVGIQGLTSRAQNLKRVCEQALREANHTGANILRVHTDRTIDDSVRTIRAGNLAKKSLQAVKAAFDREAEAGINELNDMRQRLAKTWQPPSSAGQAQVDAELRALLRTMSEVDRMAAVRTDPEFAAAAARGNAALSGLAKEFHATVRNTYAARVEPDLAGQAADLELALYGANEALGSLDEDLRGISDIQSAEALQTGSTADLA